MSHLFGTQLASWTTGIAVNCGAEWSQEAVDIGVAPGPHSTAIAPEMVALLHQNITYQELRPGSLRLSIGTRSKKSKTTCPCTPKSFPLPSFPKQDAEAESFSTHPSWCVDLPRGRSDLRVRQLHATQQLAPTEPVHEIGKDPPRLFPTGSDGAESGGMGKLNKFGNLICLACVMTSQ